MRKHHKKPKRTLINTVKKNFRRLYSNLEKPFRPRNMRKKNVEKSLKSYLTTNNICKKYYKRPQLMINDMENLERVTFHTTDGIELVANLYTPNKESNKWVIACHWFAGHKNWAIHHAKIFTEMGYNVMAFDFRGHGESQEDSTTMGAKEHLDLMGALDWLKKNRTIDELALMGTSMGAFTVNYCSLKYAKIFKEANLKFVVSDCTYGSLFRLLIHVRDIYLRFIPRKRAKKMVNKIIAKHKKAELDVDFGDASIFRLLETGYKPEFPTLFLHSKDDKVTPPSDSYELMLKRKAYVEDDYLIYNYSTHALTIKFHFKTFNYKVGQFIAKQDGTQEMFENVVSEWKLLEYDKLDDLSIKLQ